MREKTIIKVSENQDLEIPTEIKHQLQPFSEYEITFSQDVIILKKINPSIDNQPSSNMRKGSGKSILRHAGSWQGDDFEECLQSVYDNRSQIEL